MRTTTVLLAALSWLSLFASSVSAVGFIIEARKPPGFSPDVETLWNQVEEGFFRKDENGNFERFLRQQFGGKRDSIRAMGFALQASMYDDRSAGTVKISELTRVPPHHWDAAVDKFQDIVSNFHRPGTRFTIENRAEAYFAKNLILHYFYWPGRGRAPAGISPDSYHPSTSFA